MTKIGYPSEERKAQMRAYYYNNKLRWKKYRTKSIIKIRLVNNKGVTRYYLARARCLWYLVRVKKLNCRQAADRFRISDPNSVRKVLKRYERKLQ